MAPPIRPPRFLSSFLSTQHRALTLIEDDLYATAEIVKKEAQITGELAQDVQKVSRTLQEDALKVEALVEKANKKTQLINHDLDETIDKLQDSVHKVAEPGNRSTAGNCFDLGLAGSLFRVFLVILLGMVVQLHIWGGQMDFKHLSALKKDTETTASQSIPFTSFNILVLNLGSIFKLLRFTKGLLTKRKSIIAEAYENVDKAAEYVKATAKAVEESAKSVGNISKLVEQEASQVEAFIEEVKMASKDMETARP